MKRSRGRSKEEIKKNLRFVKIKDDIQNGKNIIVLY